MEQQKSYALYKGLQRPLVFKFFRGKFIYWALGAIVAGIIVGGVISALISSIAGITGLVLVSVPLLFYTISKQKNGLYSKSKDNFIGMMPPKYKPGYDTKKSI
jgi:uncharacterized oligopeptide transporter (OPT) family protein